MTIQSILSILAVSAAVQTIVICSIAVIIIFLLYKYNKKQSKATLVKPVNAAMIETSAEEEMYEIVEPGENKFQQKRCKKSNAYTK